MKVDFSIKTFSTVVQLCKELGIRHPEELSLCKPLEPNHLKYNYKDMPKKKQQESNGLQKNGHLPPDTNTFIANSSPIGSTGSLDKSHFMCAPVTPSRGPPSSTPFNTPSPANHVSCSICLLFPIIQVSHSFQTLRRNGQDVWNTSYSPNITNSLEQLNGNGFDSSLAHTKYPNNEARKHLIRPKSLVEKARMNVA